MTKIGLTVLAATLLALSLGVGLAYAGDFLIVNIQFPFKALNIAFPAGNYRIETSTAEETNEITIRNLATGEVRVLPFLTRLSEREMPHVVFDRDGDQYYLSEIYVTGIDGFQLKGAPAKHTHVKVMQVNK